MYDIIFLSYGEPNANENWQKLKEQFPNAKRASSLLDAKRKCLTRFFWAVLDDIQTNEDFDFSYEPDDWSQDVVHVFSNGDYYDGVCLIPKNNLPTEKEFEYRFFTQKKEVDIVASTPVSYDRFYIDTYEEYLNALEKTTTEFFWVIPSDVKINSNFDFSYQAPMYEKYPHVLLNGKFYDGISLHNTNSPITKKEFEYRFFTQKKEVDTQASWPKAFDIVFISYNEPNAEQNFEKLKSRFPNTKRVHGVKGIHNAHIEAAKKVKTEMFWVVDGDAQIKDDFDFDYQVPRWERDTVHVCRSQNPVNGLIYGYGGVKLLPTAMTINMDTSKPDMTTSISNKFKPIKEISNITAFNTDSFNAWKSGFRECAKLASNVIDRQKDQETKKRLDTWCNVGTNKPFGIDAIKGAKAGKEFGEINKDNPCKLLKINDFDWLKEQYDKLARR
jgi:hypothetical protein